MKNKHYQIYARDGERYDFCEGDERDYFIEYDRENDVLVVTTNTGERAAPIMEVARFFQPIRYVVDLIDD